MYKKKKPWAFYLLIKKKCKESLYLHKLAIDDEKDTFDIHQYAYNGKFIRTYSMEENGLDMNFETINGSQYLFFHEWAGNENENSVIIIVKFDPKSDKVIMVDKLEMSLLVSVSQKPEKRFLEPPVKRFGRLVLPCHSVITKQNQLFSAIDLQSKEKLFEINDLKISVSKYVLNWNLKEIGVTFRPDDPNRNDEMFFKIVNLNRSNLSLKYRSGMAVLISFSAVELRKQNIPITLIDYLGIEK